MKNKKGQAFDIILKFFLVILGLFIMVGVGKPFINFLSSMINTYNFGTFTNLLLQLFPFAIIFFLILLLFLPSRVGE